MLQPVTRGRNSKGGNLAKKKGPRLLRQWGPEERRRIFLGGGGGLPRNRERRELATVLGKRFGIESPRESILEGVPNERLNNWSA